MSALSDRLGPMFSDDIPPAFRRARPRRAPLGRRLAVVTDSAAAGGSSEETPAAAAPDGSAYLGSLTECRSTGRAVEPGNLVSAMCDPGCVAVGPHSGPCLGAVVAAWHLDVPAADLVGRPGPFRLSALVDRDGHAAAVLTDGDGAEVARTRGILVGQGASMAVRLSASSEGMEAAGYLA